MASTQVSVRTLLEAGAGEAGEPGEPGEPGLVRKSVEIPAGASYDGVIEAGGELWFAVAGYGRVECGGDTALEFGTDFGVLMPPGLHFQARADADTGLRLDVVVLPRSAAIEASQSPLVRPVADCAVEWTGDRQFRVLFGPGNDCSVATQFVGEIPPGRAPVHSHPYDEMVLVLAGEGTLHLGGETAPLSPGTCTHLPPGLPHCLENTGTTTLRVLGVFHPADSPASKLKS